MCDLSLQQFGLILFRLHDPPGVRAAVAMHPQHGGRDRALAATDQGAEAGVEEQREERSSEMPACEGHSSRQRWPA